MTTPGAHQRWRRILAELYGDARAAAVAPVVESVVAGYSPRTQTPDGWSEADAWLISYPDQFRREEEHPLAVLRSFYQTHLQPEFTGIHVLPFFPWSSDDGFAVVDYHAVDPSLGSWTDIDRLAGETRLMIDAVINHTSSQSAWFRAFLAGDDEFRAFYRTIEQTTDLSRVVRPRQTPLATRFDGHSSSRLVWTTFSADQVDLDYSNPAVLTAVLDVILAYAAHGANMIRIDAAGYLWKDEATSSIHLPETHLLIQFFRACLDVSFPRVLLLTETNVPHDENLSYLGNGSTRESQAVYLFSLPPLVLHSLLAEDATSFKDWLAAVPPPPRGTTLLNFLASHDGVGLRPAEGILDAAEIDRLVQTTLGGGGLVSYRDAGDGNPDPYELNATWFDLVASGHGAENALARHLASQAIMLALRGIPLIYVHSLFATRNDHDGVARTGNARSINRRKHDSVAALEDELGDPLSRAARCFGGMVRMLRWRRNHGAFHPDASQAIVSTPPQVVGIERVSATGERARVYVNVSGRAISLSVNPQPTAHHVIGAEASGTDIRLGPWGVAWLSW